MAEEQKISKKENPNNPKQDDGTLDSTTPLYQILNKGLTFIEATSGTLMLIDNKGEWLEIEARPGLPKEGEEEPRYGICDSSVAGWVAKTGKPYRCADVEKDSHFASPRSGQLHFKSLLSVPIIFNNKVLGVINADDKQENFFTTDHLQRLSDFAGQIAFAIAERYRRRPC